MKRFTILLPLAGEMASKNEASLHERLGFYSRSNTGWYQQMRGRSLLWAMTIAAHTNRAANAVGAL